MSLNPIEKFAHLLSQIKGLGERLDDYEFLMEFQSNPNMPKPHWMDVNSWLWSMGHAITEGNTERALYLYRCYRLYLNYRINWICAIPMASSNFRWRERRAEETTSQLRKHLLATA